MNKEKRYIILKFFLLGSTLGICFPILFLYLKDTSKEAHIYFFPNSNINSSIIFIIPIFLGIIFAFIGLHQFKIEKLSEELKKKNEELDKFKDIFEKQTMLFASQNEMLYKRSFIDEITGLENQNVLNSLKIKDENTIICILDISYFSEINSMFGYSIGDILLSKFAQRLKENYFEAYKLDGDKFAILNIIDASSSELDVFSNYVSQLISDEPFIIDGHEIFVTVKIGIASYERSNYKVEEKYIIQNLIYDANYALKYAKDRKLQYAIYNDYLKINRETQDHYEWKEKIINGIKNKNFLTYYQPIINNHNGIEEKYETLIRMKDSDGKIKSPYNFITASKKYNLYNYLTHFVFLDACDTIIETGNEISINISIDDICDVATRQLIISKISEFSLAEKIVFELLESEGIDNYDEVKKFIEEVKIYKCKIAIDDFGSGYSNFSHLLNLDIDYIKIDASLIKNIDKDSNAEEIVKTIVEFAKKINIKTIAEFVHSKKVYDKVLELGIDYSQGYYLGKPKKFICKK